MSDNKSMVGRLGAAIIACGAAFVALPASANLLTFDGKICDGGRTCFDNGSIDKSYGDVAGVVDVQYLNLSGNPGVDRLRFWSVGYNDLVNVAWTDGGDLDSRAEIFLKPLNGGVVTLNSFDLGAFSHTQRNSSFSILDGDHNVLADSGGTVLIGAGDVHSHFDFSNLSSASGIRIQWGPSAFNVGIDNVNFNVSAVPLPAPAWLLSGGLLTLLARRRRSA